MTRDVQQLKKLNEFKIMTRYLIFIFFVIVLGAISSPDAFAQNATQAKPQATKTSAAKRTTINFEDQLVEGQAQKPELFYLLQQRNNNFKRLIRLRENFLPEMRKSSEDIGRHSGAGGDN